MFLYTQFSLKKCQRKPFICVIYIVTFQPQTSTTWDYDRSNEDELFSVCECDDEIKILL